MKTSYIAILAGCLSFFASQSAQAQSIDYNSFQELFGEPVTTSANGSPQRQSEVPLNMEIMTADEIARTGARTIPEILRFIPGLSVRQQSFGQTEVGIRGYNQASSERILVLVNGRQVYTDYFGQVVWDNIPVEIGEIQQIEVVKGPNTALFGFNAVSGVVNIITYNPLYSTVGDLTLRTGLHGHREVSLVNTFKFNDKVALRVSGGGYHQPHEFEDWNSIAQDHTNRSSGSLDLWAQLTDDIQAELEVTKNSHDRNEVVAIRVPAQVEYNTSSFRGRVLANTGIGMLDADVYLNQTKAAYDFDIGLPATAGLKASNEVLVAKLNDTIRVGGNHTFRIGGEYRAGNNIYTPVDSAELQYKIYSGNGLWDWRVNEKWRTSVAARWDYFKLSPDGNNISALLPPGVNPFTAADYNQTRSELSVNLGVVYEATPKDTIRLSAARGADLPSFTEFGLQMAAPPPISNAIIGNPETDTSIVTNVELGYDRILESITGKFRASVFYQNSADMQGFGATVGGPVAGFTQSFVGNLGDSDMYGAELGIEGKWHENWDWALNYTYVNVDDHFSSAATPLNYGDSNADHIVNAHLGYTADRWRADLWGQYKSSFDDLVSTGVPNAYTLVSIDDQVMVSAALAFDITDWLEWRVSGSSLIGKTQQTVYGDVERQAFTSLTCKF